MVLRKVRTTCQPLERSRFIKSQLNVPEWSLYPEKEGSASPESRHSRIWESGLSQGEFCVYRAWWNKTLGRGQANRFPPAFQFGWVKAPRSFVEKNASELSGKALWLISNVFQGYRKREWQPVCQALPFHPRCQKVFPCGQRGGTVCFWRLYRLEVGSQTEDDFISYYCQAKGRGAIQSLRRKSTVPSGLLIRISNWIPFQHDGLIVGKVV